MMTKAPAKPGNFPSSKNREVKTVRIEHLITNSLRLYTSFPKATPLHMGICFLLAIALTGVTSSCGSDGSEPYRSIDGSGNNLRYPEMNQAGVRLIRLVTPAYTDGISSLAGSNPSHTTLAAGTGYTVASSPDKSASVTDATGQFKITVTAAVESLDVTWPGVSGADFQRVRWQEQGDGSMIAGHVHGHPTAPHGSKFFFENTTRSHTIPSLKPDVTYEVSVSIRKYGGLALAEDTATGTPLRPPNNPATGAPVVTGTAWVGERLEADTSGIMDADGLTRVSHEYQWLRNEVPISGATGSQYVAQAADMGKTLKVRVNFTDDLGNREMLTSAPTAAVTVAPGVTVDPSTLLVDEDGGTGTFDVVLNTQPSNNVTVTLTSSDTTIVTINPQTLTFTGGNWGTAQTVTVTGVDDNVDNPNDQRQTTIRMTAASSDTAYQTSRDVVTVTVTDDDDATVQGPGPVRPPNNPATGAPVVTGTARVGERLEADTSGIMDADGLTRVSHEYQWLRNEVPISGATGSQYVAQAADMGKTLKVRVNFTDDLGNREMLTSAPTAAVTVAPGVTVDPSTLLVDEDGGTGTFDVVLNTQPSNNVTVTLTSSDTTIVTINPQTLTFTGGNWGTAQTVTVTGVDDNVDNPNDQRQTTIRMTAASSDTAYQTSRDVVTVTVTDDDDATVQGPGPGPGPGPGGGGPPGDGDEPGPESPDDKVMITPRSDGGFALTLRSQHEEGSVNYEEETQTLELEAERGEELDSSYPNPTVILSPEVLRALGERSARISFEVPASESPDDPSGFSLLGRVVDISVSPELEEGESVTVCLPVWGGTSGDETPVLHRYDGELMQWEELEGQETVEDLNGLRHVCGETDELLPFGLFAQEGSPVDGDPDSGGGCAVGADSGGGASLLFLVAFALFISVSLKRRSAEKPAL